MSPRERSGGASKPPRVDGHHVIAIAEACFAAGILDQAETAAREALEWSRRLEERANEASAQWVLGQILSRRGEAAGARAQLQVALSTATALGMRPLAERCAKGLSALG